MPLNPADYTIPFSPANSFIKFCNTVTNSCSVDILTCLPYREERDISFQFRIKRGWLDSGDIAAEIDYLVNERYLVKATTDCVAGDDIINPISDFGHSYYVSHKITKTAQIQKIGISTFGWEFTEFHFSTSGGSWTIFIPNIIFPDATALAAYLQGIVDSVIPDSGVIVYASATNMIAFISTDLTFYPIKLVKRKLLGGFYVYADDLNLGTANLLYEFEVTVGVDFFNVPIASQVGVPFSFALLDIEGVVDCCSNCFCPIDDEYCYTTVLEYYCNEQDAFGFTYGTTVSDIYYPGFTNKIRLPFYLTAPQYPEASEVFRKSNGVYQKIASILEEEYICKTDYMPKEWHKCLAVAMAHDEKYVSCDIAGITNKKVESSEKHTIDWLDRPALALAMATFKVKTMPFNNFNSNMI